MKIKTGRQLSTCCGREMGDKFQEYKICPDCMEHCGIEYEEVKDKRLSLLIGIITVIVISLIVYFI